MRTSCEMSCNLPPKLHELIGNEVALRPGSHFRGDHCIVAVSERWPRPMICRWPATRRAAGASAGLLSGAILTACTNEQSVLSPRGEEANAILPLFCNTDTPIPPAVRDFQRQVEALDRRMPATCRPRPGVPFERVAAPLDLAQRISRERGRMLQVAHILSYKLANNRDEHQGHI